MAELIKNWDPKTEEGRIKLISNLDDKLAGYQTKFPMEITTGFLDIIHKANLMGHWLLNGSSKSMLAGKTINSYKGHFFDGPAGTNMDTVPVPAVYGTEPAVSAAGIMKSIGDFRTIIGKNNLYTEPIAKDLELYGTDSSFDPDTYVPDFSIHPFTGYIHIHLGTKHVHNHHAYIRKAGGPDWEAFIQWTGANFDNYRTGSTSAENLEIMLKGVIDNKELPLTSRIVQFLYTASM
jgi:hypothetical protein